MWTRQRPCIDVMNLCMVEQEKTLMELQDLFENLMRDAYDIGLEKDSPRTSQRNRLDFH